MKPPVLGKPSACPICDEVHAVYPVPRILVIQPVRLEKNEIGIVLVRRSIPPGQDCLTFPDGSLESLGDGRYDAQHTLAVQTGIHRELSAFEQMYWRLEPKTCQILLFCKCSPMRERDLPEFTPKKNRHGVVEVTAREIVSKPDDIPWSVQREAFEDTVITLRTRRLPPPMPIHPTTLNLPALRTDSPSADPKPLLPKR